MERRAVYPGTFDPITLGHIDVLKVACRLFDEVSVLVFPNRSKTPLFSISDRVEMIRLAIVNNGLGNALPGHYGGLVVQYANQIGATAIVRGLRLTTDYEEELKMAFNNHILNSQIATILIPPCQNHVHISSAAVRELLHFKPFTHISSYLDDSTIMYINSISETVT